MDKYTQEHFTHLDNMRYELNWNLERLEGWIWTSKEPTPEEEVVITNGILGAQQELLRFYEEFDLDNLTDVKALIEYPTITELVGRLERAIETIDDYIKEEM